MSIEQNVESLAEKVQKQRKKEDEEFEGLLKAFNALKESIDDGNLLTYDMKIRLLKISGMSIKLVLLSEHGYDLKEEELKKAAEKVSENP